MPHAPLKPGRKRLICDVPVRLHTTVKVHAAEAGLSLNVLLQETLERVFAGQKPATKRTPEKVT